MVLAQKAFELVQRLASQIRDGLQRRRLLRDILEDFVKHEKIMWWEILVLLAVLTARIDSLLFFTLAQISFEASCVSRDSQKTE